MTAKTDPRSNLFDFGHAQVDPPLTSINADRKGSSMMKVASRAKIETSLAVAMPLWKLHPLDLQDPCWQASSHRDLAIVRAPDEQRAREAAQRAFGVKSGFPLRGGVRGEIIAPPWMRPSLVSIEMIKDSRFEAEGPDAVLVPSFEKNLEPQSRKR